MAEERRRPRVFWFALPWLALSLPLLTAVRIRLEFPYDSLDALDGAFALADIGGPYFGLLGLWFGLRPRRGEDLPPVLDQGSRPMLGLLFVAVVSMALLIPFEIESTQGAWRRLLAWLGAVALPAWASGLLLRERGLSRWTALRGALLLGAVLVSSSVAVGVLLLLDPWAQLLPVSTAGLISAVGCVLAAWERVTASTRSVLIATAATSLSLAMMTAWQVAHPPMDSGRVMYIQAVEPGARRMVVSVKWPNVQALSSLELRTDGSGWTPLPPLTRQVKYASGIRVSTRLGRVTGALGRSGPALLCREVPGAPLADNCGPTLPTADGTILAPHPREPAVLASWKDRFVLWHLDDDRWTSVTREGETLRWPCFDASGGVLWRLQQATGPYLHQRLTPQGETVTLELGHRFQCMESTAQSPEARFERGRTLLNKPSKLYGDGLPTDGLELPGTIQVAVWSGDGSAGAFHSEENDGSYVVRFWSREHGLSDTVLVPPINDIVLNADGSLVAWPFVDGRRRSRYEVYSVPGGVLVDAGPIDGQVIAWAADGRLVLHQDGTVRLKDLRTGKAQVLFP